MTALERIVAVAGDAPRFTAPEFPSDAVIRRNAAKRDAQARWHVEYCRISRELQAEIDEIDRRFWAGEFN